jgi:hypothetical protein
VKPILPAALAKGKPNLDISSCGAALLPHALDYHAAHGRSLIPFTAT